VQIFSFNLSHSPPIYKYPSQIAFHFQLAKSEEATLAAEAKAQSFELMADC